MPNYQCSECGKVSNLLNGGDLTVNKKCCKGDLLVKATIFTGTPPSPKVGLTEQAGQVVITPKPAVVQKEIKKEVQNTAMKMETIPAAPAPEKAPDTSKQLTPAPSQAKK